MPEVSVIIPCYNSFHLMDRCLKSLENQSFKNFEVIIVDDCSTDTSYKDIISYQTKSQLQMKVYQTVVNSGPGPTRNLGIDNCSGEYITFLDSDDWVEPDWLMQMTRILRQDRDIDCVFFDYYMQRGSSNRYQQMVHHCNEGYISRHDALLFANVSTCGKIFKSQIIMEHNIRFPDIRRKEDMPFNKIAIANCAKHYYYKKPFYHYVIHSESIMHNAQFDTERNAIEAFGVVKEALGEHIPEVIIEGIFIKELLYSTVLTMSMLGKTDEEIKRHIEKYEAMFPDWSSNPSIKFLEKHIKIALYLIKHRYIWGLKIMSITKRIVSK